MTELKVHGFYIFSEKKDLQTLTPNITGVNHCLVKWSVKGTPRKIESTHMIIVNYWLQPNELINHLWLMMVLLTLLSVILLAKHGNWSHNLAIESTYNINYKEHVNNLFSTDSTARWLVLRINNHVGQDEEKHRYSNQPISNIIAWIQVATTRIQDHMLEWISWVDYGLVKYRSQIFNMIVFQQQPLKGRSLRRNHVVNLQRVQLGKIKEANLKRRIMKFVC